MPRPFHPGDGNDNNRPPRRKPGPGDAGGGDQPARRPNRLDARSYFKKTSGPGGSPQAGGPGGPGGSGGGPRFQNRDDDTGPAPRIRGEAARLPRKPNLGIMTTTLWEYPSQHYELPGSRMQGDQAYIGATPSWVIWQLLTRYTKPGDTVIDPMCGSGTTLDVCRDLERKGIGFDLVPRRPDIRKGDARKLDLPKNSVDFAFIDPPYSTHVDYSDDPRCIGKLDALGEDGGQAYFMSMNQVIGELYRVLKPGGYLGLYVSDTFRITQRAKKHVFSPIGFHLFAMMSEMFEAVDIVAVVRHNQKLEKGNWHKSAEEGNYFLRGFNYQFIMRKPERT